MLSNSKIILGFIGLGVWVWKVLEKQFLPTDKFDYLKNVISSLSLQEAIIPVGFLLVIIAGFVKQRIVAMVSAVVVAGAAGYEIYQGARDIPTIAIAVVAVLCIAVSAK